MVADDAEEEEHRARGGAGSVFPFGDADAGASEGGGELGLGHAQGEAQGGDGVLGVGGDVRAVWFSRHGCIVADGRLGRKKKYIFYTN